MFIYFVRLKAYLDGRYLQYSCDNLNTTGVNRFKTLVRLSVLLAFSQRHSIKTPCAELQKKPNKCY